MFKITWLVMILRRLITYYKYDLVSLSSHETSPKNSPSSPPPRKRKTRSIFNPSLWGYLNPIPTSFFVWIPSFTIPMKNTSQESRHQMGMNQKIVAKKKEKMPKALWFHEFSKTFTPSAEKTSAPVALSLDFPLSLHLVSPVFPGQTSWPLGGCLGWHREFDQKPRHKSIFSGPPSVV